MAETDLTQVSWSSLVARMGNCDKARGVVAGWKEVAAWLRQRSGEHFAANEDNRAKYLRDVALLIEEHIPAVEAKREDDHYGIESALWAEIDRRETLPEEKTGAQ